MSETAKITSKNQIALAAKVRNSLGVRAGDKVDFIRNAAGNFALRARTEVLSDLIGARKAEVPASADDIAAWINEARQKLKHGNATIASVIRRLLNMSNVSVPDEAIIDASSSAFIQNPGDFSDHLAGTINKHNGCRTALTFDKAAARSLQFSELQR